METILNLSLKKDVFDGLKNGETNEILIEKTNWWKKRLMDLDTGRFKKFDVARVSSGSSDKLNYDIESIELKEGSFVITLKREVGEVITPTVINPVTIEPVKVNPVTIEPQEEDVVVVHTPEPVSELTQKMMVSELGETEIVDDEPEPEPEEEEPEDGNTKEVIANIFNSFCEMKDVFVVNMPYVTIRPNGQIIGCKRRLVADRENDVRFTFTVKEFTKYPNDTNTYFLLVIKQYIHKLLQNNYVFVNRHASGFKEDEWGNLIFTFVATAKKKYIFPKQ